MKLSIIITHYTESEEQAYNSLSSIDMQRNIDFSDYEVIVVNDAGPEEKRLSESFLSSFKNIKPKYLIKETNTGPGDARNYGIEHSTGDYVCFIDCADCFVNVYTLSMFEEVIHTGGQDVAITQWTTPTKVEGKWLYPVNNFAPAWVFGWFYRRAFLDLHSIRFPTYKIWNEEWAVNGKCMVLTDRIQTVDFLTYSWTHDENISTSITTVDGHSYNYRITPSWITVQEELLDWNKKVSKLNDNDPFIIALQIYSMMNSFAWDRPESLPYKERTEEIISWFIGKWDYLISSIGIKEKSAINAQVSARMERMPDETFDGWYKRLKEKNITTKPDLLL